MERRCRHTKKKKENKDHRKSRQLNNPVEPLLHSRRAREPRSRAIGVHRPLAPASRCDVAEKLRVRPSVKQPSVKPVRGA